MYVYIGVFCPDYSFDSFIQFSSIISVTVDLHLVIMLVILISENDDSLVQSLRYAL